MKNSKGAKAIKEVASKNGVSVAEVRREIEIAIDAALFNPNLSPEARTFWDKYIQNGCKPTPEEFIVYMTNKIKSEKKP